MAIRKILNEKDEMLHKRCREVTNFDGRIQALFDDLFDTLDTEDGAGLAAPQIGVLRRVCVVCTDEDNETPPILLVNPVVISTEGMQEGAEGCLSVPNKTGLVNRPEKAVIEAQDRNGNKFTLYTEGFEARAALHEIDHLDGILYIDKMTRFMTQKEADAWEEKRMRRRKKQKTNDRRQQKKLKT